MNMRYVYGLLVVMTAMLNGADNKSDHGDTNTSLGMAALENIGTGKQRQRSKSLGDDPMLIRSLRKASAGILVLTTLDDMQLPQPRVALTATDSGSQPPRTLTPPLLDNSLKVVPESSCIQPRSFFTNHSQPPLRAVPHAAPSLQPSVSRNFVPAARSLYDDSDNNDSDSETDDPRIFDRLDQALEKQESAAKKMAKRTNKLWHMLDKHKGDLRKFYTASNSSAASHSSSSASLAHTHDDNANSHNAYRPLPRSSDVQPMLLPMPSLQPLIIAMESQITSMTASNAMRDAATNLNDARAISARIIDMKRQSFLYSPDLQTPLLPPTYRDPAALSSDDDDDCKQSGRRAPIALRPVVLNGTDESKDRCVLSSDSLGAKGNNTASNPSKTQLVLAAVAGSVATVAYQQRNKIAGKCVVQ